MQMCGLNYRRVRPAHIVSVGPSDMLQFREMQGLDLTRQQVYYSPATPMGM
jgi:hypothetical protein